MTTRAPLVSSLEAAKTFGISRTHFNRLVKEGKVPIAIDMDGRTGARLFDADVIDILAADYQARAAS